MGAIPEQYRINTGVTPYTPSGEEGPVMNLLFRGARFKGNRMCP